MHTFADVHDVWGFCHLFYGRCQFFLHVKGEIWKKSPKSIKVLHPKGNAFSRLSAKSDKLNHVWMGQSVHGFQTATEDLLLALTWNCRPSNMSNINSRTFIINDFCHCLEREKDMALTKLAAWIGFRSKAYQLSMCVLCAHIHVSYMYAPPVTYLADSFFFFFFKFSRPRNVSRHWPSGQLLYIYITCIMYCCYVPLTSIYCYTGRYNVGVIEHAEGEGKDDGITHIFFIFLPCSQAFTFSAFDVASWDLRNWFWL